LSWAWVDRNGNDKFQPHNKDIVLRMTKDRFAEDDDELKKLVDDLRSATFTVKLVVDIKIAPKMLQLPALRPDVIENGQKWYDPRSWGADMKIGLIVSREGVPTSITNCELQLRVQRIICTNMEKNLSIHTQRKYIACKFVSNFREFLDHKWKPEDFQTDWYDNAGRIAGWAMAGAVVVGGCAAYVWYKGGAMLSTMKGWGKDAWGGVKGLFDSSDDSSEESSSIDIWPFNDSDEDSKKGSKDSKKGSKDSEGLVDKMTNSMKEKRNNYLKEKILGPVDFNLPDW